MAAVEWRHERWVVGGACEVGGAWEVVGCPKLEVVAVTHSFKTLSAE